MTGNKIKKLQGDNMAFSGKATYTAGTTLPEIAEDVADLIADLAAALEKI